MHISFIDGKIVIYLNETKFYNIDFEDSDATEKYFRNLFNILKKNYDIKINGYYNIKIYKDKLYGIVLEMEEENIDYIDFFDNQVEMNIELINSNFLYKIDDYLFLDSRENIILYNYYDKLYMFLKNRINMRDYMNLMEFSELIYGIDAEKILNNGHKIIIN